ncbi:histone-lysine N-methyltransferase SETMAR [Plakobranchus ocellatus]|uniref:Histone-lysine N-methyltransferase SETMAR n=1 Tax=Plakobranchus ocellatus TaxID=259542 RepID=A0AAV4A6B0_9GAST|nr:histone-lysine N-methyltransferase SETMAR [Plakobranchus ocellatus]
MRLAISLEKLNALTNGVILQGDSLTLHTAKTTKDCIKTYNIPFHSPDLALSNYRLAGKKFDNDYDIVKAVNDRLKPLAKNFPRKVNFPLSRDGENNK